MNTTVKALFEQVCNVYNLRTRKDVTTKQDNHEQLTYYSHDFVKMDYNSVYGGYRIDIVTTGTGERDFDGSSRKPAKEMIAYLRGLLAAKAKYTFERIIKNELK